MTTTVLVAGATGMLGGRIATELIDQLDVDVRLMLRASALGNTAKTRAVDALVSDGAVVALGDVTDPDSLDKATAGVDVVVSALQGGPDVIIDGQIALAEAAVRSRVRRFVSSDFAIDLYNAPTGAPQFDIRREADARIDSLPLEVVHVLNGGFMDLMLDPRAAHIIDLEKRTATIWGTGDEPFNLTTVDDTARFTARIATDPSDVSGVRYLTGAETSFNQIIAAVQELWGATPTRNVLGSVDDLRRITSQAADPWSVVPLWYLLSMLTVPPFPGNDNERYPDLTPTGLRGYLVSAQQRHLRTAGAPR